MAWPPRIGRRPARARWRALLAMGGAIAPGAALVPPTQPPAGDHVPPELGKHVTSESGVGLLMPTAEDAGTGAAFGAARPRVLLQLSDMRSGASPQPPSAWPGQSDGNGHRNHYEPDGLGPPGWGTGGATTTIATFPMPGLAMEGVGPPPSHEVPEMEEIRPPPGMAQTGWNICRNADRPSGGCCQQILDGCCEARPQGMKMGMGMGASRELGVQTSYEYGGAGQEGSRGGTSSGYRKHGRHHREPHHKHNRHGRHHWHGRHHRRHHSHGHQHHNNVGTSFAGAPPDGADFALQRRAEVHGQCPHEDRWIMCFHENNQTLEVHIPAWGSYELLTANMQPLPPREYQGLFRSLDNYRETPSDKRFLQQCCIPDFRVERFVIREFNR